MMRRLAILSFFCLSSVTFAGERGSTAGPVKSAPVSSTPPRKNADLDMPTRLRECVATYGFVFDYSLCQLKGTEAKAGRVRCGIQETGSHLHIYADKSTYLDNASYFISEKGITKASGIDPEGFAKSVPGETSVILNIVTSAFSELKGNLIDMMPFKNSTKSPNILNQTIYLQVINSVCTCHRNKIQTSVIEQAVESIVNNPEIIVNTGDEIRKFEKEDFACLYPVG